LQQWEWHNNYSPGLAVYDQLWHIRKEPATVTPFLPTECPLQNAQSRITDRSQTEGEVQRNFYVVEVTNFNGRETSLSSVEGGASSTEIYHVDLSRILEYVSPEELERFENEQFRVEAEAEAVAMRIQVEKTAHRRLEKHARAAAAGQGSRMPSALGFNGALRTRGRPRGRGRGRGRGSWCGRGALTKNSVEDMREELVDAEVEDALHSEEDMQLTIAETESEEEDLEAEAQARTSPTIARSAFVANSALPVSPVLSHRRPVGIPIVQREPTTEDDEESDIELINRNARSTSSAAMQLRIEDDDRGRSIADSDEDTAHRDLHYNKRRRTESTASNQRHPLRQESRSELNRTNNLPYPPSTIAQDSEGPLSPPWSVDAGSVAEPIEMFRSRHAKSLEAGHDNITVQSPVLKRNSGHQSEGKSENEDEDAEEYVVEAITEHYCDADKRYYLVKWQGFEDSHDWLPEEDLEGAADLVAEYNEKVQRRKLSGKQKMKQ
jgi:hypothetical protein